MNKKLLAAAVAGALTLPAGAAMAQTSTVQIYGLFNVEYAPYVRQPDAPGPVSRTTNDQINSTVSRMGFRGQEKLGGGLTAWFQCETTLSFLTGGTDDEAPVYDSDPQTNFCDRNSALGLRGGWGNFYIGLWDSPVKRASGATRMLNLTGWLGAERLLLTLSGTNYSHRVTKSLNYESPNIGGFTIALQTTTNNADRNQVDIGTPPGSAAGSGAGTDGRIWGINGIYRGGPLVVSLGYQKYENQIQLAAGPYPAVGGVDGRDDEVWVAGASYVFGAFKLGGTVANIEADNLAVGTETERRSYNLALEWTLGGPHMMRFGWTHAGQTEGPGAAAASSGSANQYQISYIHSLSKRTRVSVGYVMLDNGDGGVYNLQALASGAANVRAGERASALSLQMIHTF